MLFVEMSFLQSWSLFFFFLTEHPSVVPDCTGQACHLEILSDVLLVLFSLLLPHLADVVLQLHDGSLDLVVLTHEGHPAIKVNKQNTVTRLQSKWSLNKTNISKL